MNSEFIIVEKASNIERAEFYKKTYLHVAFALLAFIGLETLLLNIVPMQVIATMLSGKMVWLFILGLFWLGSILSNKLSYSEDKTMQYAGLGLFVLIEALIFMPLLLIAMYTTNSLELISQAAIITLFMFGGLTAVAFLSNKDFSFLRTAIVILGFISLGLILAGMLFGFDLGLWFSVGMVILASASILYKTSQIKYHYGTHQYVGAALSIFASVMLLFWYVLRILMSRRS